MAFCPFTYGQHKTNLVGLGRRRRRRRGRGRNREKEEEEKDEREEGDMKTGLGRSWGKWGEDMI